MLFRCFLLSFAVRSITAGIHNINMTEYYKMPPLNSFHDYDKCLIDLPHETGVYCFVSITIQPNTSNPLWNYIETFSADHKHHFRHDRLQRGLCVKTCKNLLEKYDYLTKMKYYLKKIDTTNEVHLEANTYAKALDYKIKYNKLLNQCVNYELRRQYGLMGYSNVEFCTTSKDHRNLDSLDNAFIIVTALLITVVTLASVYDVYLERQNSSFMKPGTSHYTQVVPTKVPQIFLVFSLPRNWFRLVTPSDASTQKELRFIESIRVLTMFGVLVAHSTLLSQVYPISNPEYVEKKYSELLVILLLNGFKVIQTFFTISGFLQAVQFLDYIEKEKHFQFSVLGKSILYRYFRLLPVYGYMMLLDATLLVHIHDGPVWPKAAETQKYFCRNNWWTNVLFINNYFATSEPCLQQSWYLAVDFQLFIVGMVLLMIIWKFPQSKRFVFAIALSVAWLIPAIVTYHNNFDGVVIIEPEASKHIQTFDLAYKRMYIPTHTNMGSFLTGLLGGFIYKNIKVDNLMIQKSKALFYAWYAVVPTGFFLVLSAYIFYAYDFEKPSLFLSLYASFTINVWGVLVTVLFIGITSGIGKMIKSMMNCRVFVPLGRLTYCTFLCHTFVLRATTGDLRYPIYLTDNFFTVTVMSTTVLSYVISAVLCLCIELPASNLQKMFVNSKKDAE